MDFPVPLPATMLALAQSLNVRAEDIDEQFVRGSGKGGQKVNKTASTVLLRHLPTGIEVRCQEYREQSTNRLIAYKRLIGKIEEAVRGKESAKAQKIFKLRRQKARRSRKAKEKVLKEKHHRSDIKQQRAGGSGLE